MNKLTYYFYGIFTSIGEFLNKKMGTDAAIRYKLDHDLKLNIAENLTVLRDVDRVIYNEMTLSEYINKWGTIYVDEKFQELFVKDRPETPNPPKPSLHFHNKYKPSDELPF